ncbi:MAG: DEAD/DEAH box helicase [Cyanobacteria bacterium MAG CAR1_bin_15]|nr:DEAD/DEAH box helicase [Cyanobacteria bacterium MAG CAR1_bin_15]
MFNAQEFLEKLHAVQALHREDKVEHRMVDRIEPAFAESWPDDVHPSLRTALRNEIGIPAPYTHQLEAINHSLRGLDVVMESPTASGKTLAFAIPMLDAIVQNRRRSHALMIYPMKALAFDQREQLKRLCTSINVESWPYDGDTPKEHRNVLRRRPPEILLTNPEYLNTSFLAWRNQWTTFLQRLQFVVIDEMHEYRGFFGGNVALLLRRFFLQLKRMGSQPTIFLSTATCENPEEHARRLTGRTNVEIVSARDVLRPRRHFIFVNPDIPDFRYRDFLRERVERASLVVLREGLQALVFCPTKRFLEDAFSNTKANAQRSGLESDGVSAFHADLNKETRQDIQQGIKSGKINIVFTTNALELGLDIGGLDGVILAGFPASTMSAWQQIGRAGRGWNKDAFVLFYAMNDPIDCFFAANLDVFLNRTFDELVIDPSNQQLIENHLPSLAHETDGNITTEEQSILGQEFYEAALSEMGEPALGNNYRPQQGIRLRGGVGRSFNLRRGNEKIGEISEIRRFREAYIGAVFTFFGHRYRVRSHEEDTIVLENAEPNIRTEGSFYNIFNINTMFKGYRYSVDEHMKMKSVYASLNIEINFTGYKLIDEHTDEQRSTGGTQMAYREKNLHCFLLNFTTQNGDTGAIGALEHLIRVGAMFIIPADRFDTSTYSKLKSAEDSASIYYYENYSGGIGVARKLSEVWPKALKKGIEVAENCQCSHGCPNCIVPAKSYNISNANIEKTEGIKLGRHLLQIVHNGPDSELRNSQWKSL